MTVFEVVKHLCRNPRELLIEKWNWKSALLSSVLRALIFLVTNLSAGWRAATGAMFAEFVYRAMSAGFYGSITQAFREAEPEWAAGTAAALVVPILSHSIEFTIHWLRGTPKILTSMIVSVCFTTVSTLFNFYAMRRGALITGEDAATLRADLQRIPELVGSFLAAGPVAIYAKLRPSAAAAWQAGAERVARKQYL